MKKTKVLQKKLPKKIIKRKNSSVMKKNKNTKSKVKIQKKVEEKILIKEAEIIKDFEAKEINDSLEENKDQFLYYSNDEILGDMDAFLKDAELDDLGNAVYFQGNLNENENFISEKISEIEKLVQEDAVNSELFKKNFNYKIQLNEEDGKVIGTIENKKVSKNLVNLKEAQVKKLKILDDEFRFDIPKKKTLKGASSSYLRDVSKIFFNNRFMKFVYFLGFNTSNFVKYSFYPVYFVATGVVSATATAIVSVNVLGKNVYGFFIYSEKNNKQRKNLKSEILKIQPRKFLKPSGLKIYPRVLGFVISAILIIIIINFSSFVNKLNETKGRVLGISEQAYQNLEDGIKSMMGSDFDNAQSNFFDANQKFIQAESEISQNGEVINQILKLIPNQGEKLSYGEKLIETGKLLSESAGYINTALMDQEGLTITQKIKLIQENLEKCKDNLKKVAKNISEVDENVLPGEYREKFRLMKEKFPILTSNIDNLTSLFDVSTKILGSDSAKRYLFLFQNNNELRPTGGFIGSLAIVDIEDGEIKNIFVPGGGPYDYRAGIKDNFIAPKPMWLINPNFYFWDMNWWADAPTSYYTILESFERAGGPTVDGVISLNSDVMVEFLKLTGPVHLDEQNIDINSENFYKEVQDIVEFQYDKEENKPKKIIGEMMNKMLTRLFNEKNINYLDMIKLFDKSISNKDIQMYFTDSSLESVIDNYGWSGGIEETSKDYLSVINTNIGGGKTDEFIKQQINHKVEVLSNGNIVDTVKIIRKFEKQEDNIFSSKKNKNYIRIYVPLGSELLEAGGFDKFPEKDYVKPSYGSQEFPRLLELQGRVSIDKSSGIEIYDEIGKTTYAGWQEINPGEERIVYVKYQLPFRLSFESLQTFLNGLFKEDANKIDSYSIVYQKQSGIDSKLNYEYRWSDNLKLVWSNLEKFNTNIDFSHDFANGFILDKK